MKNPTVCSVILTDTHLFEKSTKKDSIIDCNYDEVIEVFKQAIQLAIDHKIDKVIHAGDFFDSRKHQSQNLLRMAYSILELFRKSNLKLVLVTGNHDKTDYRDSFSFMSVFKDHPNLQLIEDWGWYDDHENKIRYQFIAYFDNDIYKQHLDHSKTVLSETYKNVLITHIGIHGALRNSGEKEESSLTFEMFSDFDKVLIGHFHDYSSHINKKIIYVGSALQHNFGENNIKGILLLDSSLKLTRIKSSFKEYVTTEINIEDVTQEDIEDLISRKESLHQRIVFIGDDNLIKSFDKSKLIDNGIKYTVKSDQVEIKQIEQRMEFHSTESIAASFIQYCKDKSYDELEGLPYLNKAI